jgi:hypothetical protein
MFIGSVKLRPKPRRLNGWRSDAFLSNPSTLVDRIVFAQSTRAAIIYFEAHRHRAPAPSTRRRRGPVSGPGNICMAKRVLRRTAATTFIHRPQETSQGEIGKAEFT